LVDHIISTLYFISHLSFCHLRKIRVRVGVIADPMTRVESLSN